MAEIHDQLQKVLDKSTIHIETKYILSAMSQIKWLTEENKRYEEVFSDLEVYFCPHCLSIDILDKLVSNHLSESGDYTDHCHQCGEEIDEAIPYSPKEYNKHKEKRT